MTLSPPVGMGISHSPAFHFSTLLAQYAHFQLPLLHLLTSKKAFLPVNLFPLALLSLGVAGVRDLQLLTCSISFLTFAPTQCLPHLVSRQASFFLKISHRRHCAHQGSHSLSTSHLLRPPLTYNRDPIIYHQGRALSTRDSMACRIHCLKSWHCLNT